VMKDWRQQNEIAQEDLDVYKEEMDVRTMMSKEDDDGNEVV